MRAALLLMLALAGAAPALTRTTLTAPALAETNRIALPRQHGITFLPFLEMEGRLIEKHARALGLPDLQVEWVVLSGAGPVNDGLLSGALSFGAGAAPSLVLLWDRTRASPNPVRGIGAIAAMPTYLNTRNPAIASIADYTEADRIALPSAKLSNAAIVLQMAAGARPHGRTRTRRGRHHVDPAGCPRIRRTMTSARRSWMRMSWIRSSR